MVFFFRLTSYATLRMYDISKNFHDFAKRYRQFNSNAYTWNTYKYFTLLNRILYTLLSSFIWARRRSQ